MILSEDLDFMTLSTEKKGVNVYYFVYFNGIRGIFCMCFQRLYLITVGNSLVAPLF